MVSFHSHEGFLMNKIFLSLIAISLIFLGSCSKGTEKPCEVLVSIPPYLYFIEALTGGQVQTTSLVPSGANPHIYEATPKQVQQAQQAKVWIRLNENFEVKIAQSLKEQNKDLITLNLADSPQIPYLYEGHVCSSCSHHHAADSKDPHIWLSLRLAKIQANLIAEILIQAFPNKKDLIEKNLLILQGRFSHADSLFTEKLSPYKNDSILVSHPAFGYFCRDYSIKQISIELEGKDPLPRQLTSILTLAKTTPIRTVLTQVQYNNKGAELIAKQLHLPIHEVDPYSPNYMQNLEQLVQDIVEP